MVHFKYVENSSHKGKFIGVKISILQLERDILRLSLWSVSLSLHGTRLDFFQIFRSEDVLKLAHEFSKLQINIESSKLG